MDWQERIIRIYLIICQVYDSHLRHHCERYSNNCTPVFTDQEVLTIYIFGMMEHHYTVKSMYRHTKEYLHQWFPALPRYEAFNARLLFLCNAFEALLPVLERMIGFS